MSLLIVAYFISLLVRIYVIVCRRAQVAYEDVLAIEPCHRAAYQYRLARLVSTSVDAAFATWNVWERLTPDFWDSYCKKAPAVSSDAAMTVDSTALVDMHELSFASDEQRLLIELAHRIGRVLHDATPLCTIVSSRTQRMFGCSSLIMSQCIRQRVARGEFAILASSGDRTMHQLGWRDLVDMFVRWRSIAEPNEATIWLDHLDADTVRDGFALHTPLLNGAQKVLRHAPYFQRALTLTKQLMQVQCPASFDSATLDAATSVSALHQAVGGDFFVVNEIHRLQPGFEKPSDLSNETLAGVNVTVMEREPSSFLFSISTPSCPLRWHEYDAVLEDIFNLLISLLEDAATSGQGTVLAVDEYVDVCLTFFYYLVNFGPLSHASASAALACVCAFLTAAGLSVAPCALGGVILEWEALLATTPVQFIAACRRANPLCLREPAFDHAPLMSAAFGTIGECIQAVNMCT